jgi:hypothetical protein
MRRRMIWLAMMLSWCPSVFAEDKTGLKVGETAPDFVLKDQVGQEHSLKELRKDRVVALVFYRSANW